MNVSSWKGLVLPLLHQPSTSVPQLWPFSGLVVSCVMSLSLALCSMGLFPSSLQQNHFSSSALRGLQGLSLPACHWPMGNGHTSVSLQPLPFYLGWPHGWFPHGHFSFCPSPSKTKERSQNEQMFPNGFPLLNRFVSRGADWHSAGQRQGKFETQGA